ncbi:hypothetical protein SKP52_18180 [Sphingopyxis fribergensis]|uniref:Uncharacterized protein n=1 Tax=Sphingopyxis fribergensis TaxID=1515612 RepID=A0A0A7PK75_9SPHN|nr:hypothetical protein SKP52_18180 [Sphingopyxis fribergensis]
MPALLSGFNIASGRTTKNKVEAAATSDGATRHRRSFKRNKIHVATNSAAIQKDSRAGCVRVANLKEMAIAPLLSESLDSPPRSWQRLP